MPLWLGSDQHGECDDVLTVARLGLPVVIAASAAAAMTLALLLLMKHVDGMLEAHWRKRESRWPGQVAPEKYLRHRDRLRAEHQRAGRMRLAQRRPRPFADLHTQTVEPTPARHRRQPWMLADRWLQGRVAAGGDASGPHVRRERSALGTGGGDRT